jgi:hypothetical protein
LKSEIRVEDDRRGGLAHDQSAVRKTAVELEEYGNGDESDIAGVGVILPK